MKRLFSISWFLAFFILASCENDKGRQNIEVSPMQNLFKDSTFLKRENISSISIENVKQDYKMCCDLVKKISFDYSQRSKIGFNFKKLKEDSNANSKVHSIAVNNFYNCIKIETNQLPPRMIDFEIYFFKYKNNEDYLGIIIAKMPNFNVDNKFKYILKSCILFNQKTDNIYFLNMNQQEKIFSDGYHNMYKIMQLDSDLFPIFSLNLVDNNKFDYLSYYKYISVANSKKIVNEAIVLSDKFKKGLKIDSLYKVEQIFLSSGSKVDYSREPFTEYPFDPIWLYDLEID